MSTNRPDTDFELRLHALANWPNPPIQRLRLFLKRALRAYGVRCDLIRPLAPEPPSSAEGAKDAS